jgi:hypothetical protein
MLSVFQTMKLRYKEKQFFGWTGVNPFGSQEQKKSRAKTPIFVPTCLATVNACFKPLFDRIAFHDDRKPFSGNRQVFTSRDCSIVRLPGANRAMHISGA